MENLINLFIPTRCMICSTVGSTLCDSCLGSSKILNRIFFYENNLDVFCLFEYGGCVNKCIRYSKYSPRLFSGLKLLVSWGLDHISIPNYHDYVVVPIPLSKNKIKRRGFNQAVVISKILVRKYSLRFDPELIVRTKNTAPQYTLDKMGRIENLRDAFVCTRDVRGKKILLTDDICTTGSTFISASKVLYKAGASSVRCFSLSKKL